MSRKHTRILMPLILLALALWSLPLFAHSGHGEGEVAPYDLDTPRKVTPETAAHIGLLTQEVDFGSVEDTIQLVGVVRPVPSRVHSVAARVAGTVGLVNVQVGDVVKQGDLLAELDSPELIATIYELRKLETDYFALQSQLAMSRSRIDEYEVKLDTARQHASIAQAEYDRLRQNEDAVAVNKLSEKQTAAVRTQSEARLTDIELTLARRTHESMSRQADSMALSRAALEQVIETMANSDRDGTRRSVASADPEFSFMSDREGEMATLGLVKFFAPISGVVIAREVMAGQGISEGDDLLTIAEYSSVQIEGELPESLVSRIDSLEGRSVRIRRVSDTESDPIALGTVRFVSPVIDPIKRTTHVLIEVDNSDGVLRDGQYVDLTVVLREEPLAVVVPASAVITDGPMHFVFIKDGEFYQKQDINPGARDDQVVEVLDGLLPGDVVVVRGAYSLTQLRPKVAAVSSDDNSDG
jgi:RND family efflux transporter MFP subunit